MRMRVLAILLVACAGMAPRLTAASPADSMKAPNAKRAAPAKADTSACIVCHRTGDEARLRKPVETWKTDAHAAAGLGCESCHGGDPQRTSITDPDEAADHAMDPAKGFKPPPDRLEMAKFCAHCHSDAAYMKRYNPGLRVDQYAEYQTSVHGKLNAKGDETPATCIDCHGAHGIRPVAAPDAPVFATNVPKTCARCHADAAKMAPYKIPTNQFEDYKAGMHGAALLEGGDTAAPACNDCHGNHGATPPEVSSVAQVCGTCHAREAILYQASPKKAIFERLKAPQCIVCHSNHRIRHPTPELFHHEAAPEITAGKILSNDPFAANLGDMGSGARIVATWRDVLRPHVDSTDARFAHMVEVRGDGIRPVLLAATVRPGALAAPLATHGGGSGIQAALTIEPLSGLPIKAGDALLFRLEVATPTGATHRVQVRDIPGQAVDPVAGSPCFSCHKLGDSCDVASERMYASLSHLDRDLRDADRMLDLAEVAGMDVSEAKFELKNQGTTAAVEAKALIHSFDPDRLVRRATEGRAAAAKARKVALAAQEELQKRRKGLGVSLIFVVLVLVGLYLKIREVDREREMEESRGRIA
jgi:hypothetical protein